MLLFTEQRKNASGIHSEEPFDARCFLGLTSTEDILFENGSISSVFEESKRYLIDAATCRYILFCNVVVISFLSYLKSLDFCLAFT